MSSIVDKPKRSDQSDLLEIEKYTTGLTKFIKTSQTPITIGIQGEWGSGKTSLLNTVREDLCEQPDSKFFGVWVNTWEYSLLSSPDETLIKITLSLISQIGSLNANEGQSASKRAANICRSMLKGASKATGLIGAAALVASQAIDGDNCLDERSSDIRALRHELEALIENALKTHHRESFIFFIDDLDRLDPAVAVGILELLKNLFDLSNCIFLLAIDYGVVVKGLQSKFGEMTEKNEWEFRAFFDKIIQLPFSMPVSSYNIKNFLRAILIEVNYFDSQELSPEIMDLITQITNLSVGGNPRSLKRLANSVSLIEIIRDDQKIPTNEKVIEFALICVQIAYPLIYGLISNKPNFEEWDERDIARLIRDTEINESEINLLAETEEFNERWEQNLWRICQTTIFLRERTYQISILLNLIRSMATKISHDFGLVIERLLTMSAVTSINVAPKAKKQAHNPGIYYFNVGEGAHRNWDDDMKFGFIAAGQAPKYSAVIKKCAIGDILVAYLKGFGYVGVGRVISRGIPAAEYLHDGELLKPEDLKQPALLGRSENPDSDEWVIPVEWIIAVEREKAVFEKNAGLFTTPLTRASLENQASTIEFINSKFGINLHDLLTASN